jgi:hypothetical protein
MLLKYSTLAKSTIQHTERIPNPIISMEVAHRATEAQIKANPIRDIILIMIAKNKFINGPGRNRTYFKRLMRAVLGH